MSKIKPTSLILCMGISLCLLPHHAQAQSSEAEALNEEGKKHFKERRYLEAYKLFKRATEKSPEGRFFFNLCFSLNYLERFQEAIDACERVEPNGADEKLLKKTNAVLNALRAKVPQKPVDDPNTGDPNTGDPNTGDPNTGDPNTGDPNTGDPNTGTGNTNVAGPAQVPGFDPFREEQEQGYQWALGGTLGPILNPNVGNEAPMGAAYGGAGFRLGVFADFMYSELHRIGLQGSLGLTTLPPEADGYSKLSIVDFGAAAFKHFRITDTIDVTPSVGVHVSLMQPEPDEQDALISVGARAQGSVNWAFGPSQAHVLSIAPALTLYSPATDSSSVRAATYGLDVPGSVIEVNFGYQYRFKTPFGAGPLFTLE
jgi:hypothetical protein